MGIQRQTRGGATNFTIAKTRILGGGGEDGDPASDQGWGNKFYHCQNPYFGKSRGGDVP